MPTSYTSLLGLALPVTGELAGTWGDTVNDYLTKYLDAAVAGAQTISGSQTAVTLTTTNGSTLTQAGSGSTGSAQYQIINCTGNPASLLTITVPAQSKAYLVLNATSTSQSVKVVGAGPTTGVTMVSGEKALIAWDGSDFVKVASSTADGVTTLSFGTTGLTPNSATAGAITVAGTLVAANGGTGQSSYTTGDLLYATGSTALSKLGIGTNGQVLTSTGTAPQWSTLSGVAVTTFSAGTTGFTPSTATSGAITLAGTLATTNGGTGLTSFTANGVVYASSTSALTTGSALTFDGNVLATSLSGGTGLAMTSSASQAYINLRSVATAGFEPFIGFGDASAGNICQMIGILGGGLRWTTGGSEQMRLTSTGLGIGTSSPASKLHVVGSQYRQNDSTNSFGFTLNTTSATTTLATLFGGSSFAIQTGGSGTNQLTLDSSGNLGLGVTPSAWNLSGLQAMQIKNASLAGYLNNAYLSANAFFAGGWLYVGNGLASQYVQADGEHRWSIAASGTAGNAISFTQAMTLDASGRLALGRTSATNYGAGATTLSIDGTAGGWLDLYFNGSRKGLITGTTSSLTLDTATGNTLNFNVEAVERARITTGGDFGIGTSSPSYKLQVGDGSADTRALFLSNNNFSIGVGRSAGTIGKWIGSPSDNVLTFSRNDGTEQMRLDSSGNLGLGVTPSAWGQGRAFEISAVGEGLWGNGLGDIWMINGAYFNSGWKYSGTTRATAYRQGAGTTDGSHAWYTAPSGTAGNAITFTQAMTLDASGVLLVGATSALGVTGEKVTISNNNNTVLSIVATNDTTPSIQFNSNSVDRLTIDSSSNYGAYFNVRSNQDIRLGTNNTERARITSGGDLLVGKTSSDLGTAGIEIFGAGYGQFTANNDASLFTNRLGSDGDTVKFYRATSLVGSISVTTSATAYNTSSDYRLKDNPQPLTGSGAFIDALKPKTWNWKTDGSKGVGFIAHEVQEVSPASVTGEKDGEQMQAMEYGSAEFIANIIAELQSLRARVAQLEAK